MAEATQTKTKAVGAAKTTKVAKAPKATAPASAATEAAAVTRSRQGVGATKGETVRIVRRQNEEKDDGVQSWHIWKQATNQNVVGTRFPSAEEATAYAKSQGWEPVQGRQPKAEGAPAPAPAANKEEGK